MDTRVVFAVLLVTLCWFSVSTYAQSTTNATTASTTNATAASTTNATAASTTNATAASTTNATAASTTNATAASTTNATAASTTNGTDASTTNATAASTTNATAASTTNGTDASTTNATAASTANATAASTTNATAASTANATAASTANATAASTTNATAASNTTTVTDATTASGNGTTSVTTPLTPNITVEALETNISRTGCGSDFLCASEPSSCDPSGSGCFFFSARQREGDNFNLSLAGESDGYVAATLSSDSTLGGNDTTYVCANNNGTVKFIPAVLDNNQLTNVSELNVNTVRGKIIGNIIQCTFAATVPSSSARSTSLTLAISTGSFNSTTGQLGAPTNKLRSSSVNLANPNATVTNELSNTTSNAITFKQSLTQALLISAGMMGLTLL